MDKLEFEISELTINDLLTELSRRPLSFVFIYKELPLDGSEGIKTNLSWEEIPTALRWASRYLKTYQGSDGELLQ